MKKKEMKKKNDKNNNKIKTYKPEEEILKKSSK